MGWMSEPDAECKKVITLIRLRINDYTTKNFCGKCLFKKKKNLRKIPHEEEMQLHRSHY